MQLIRRPARPASSRLALLVLAGILLPPMARGSMTVLVGEPFGSFGTTLPVGHVAIYLDHVCADGPLKVRACQPGEPQGVVIARYHNIGPVDWVASPVLEFLYAVLRADEVPEWVDADQVWALQQRYRRRSMAALVPDGHELDRATNEWWETAGAAYNRRIWGYRLDTTASQDAQLVATLNADSNRHNYHVRRTNCANFVADIVNFYYPGAVRRGDRVADFGLMTPKQVARSVERYGKKHPQTHLQVIEIPQVPGSLRRSRPVRGAAEAGLKTKRYLFPLLAIQPEVPATLAVLYAIHGRWRMGRDAKVVGPYQFESVQDRQTDLAESNRQTRCGGDALRDKGISCPSPRVDPTD